MNSHTSTPASIHPFIRFGLKISVYDCNSAFRVLNLTRILSRYGNLFHISKSIAISLIFVVILTTNTLSKNSFNFLTETNRTFKGWNNFFSSISFECFRWFLFLVVRKLFYQKPTWNTFRYSWKLFQKKTSHWSSASNLSHTYSHECNFSFLCTFLLSFVS